jgi:hypothetical protein
VRTLSVAASGATSLAVSTRSSRSSAASSCATMTDSSRRSLASRSRPWSASAASEPTATRVASPTVAPALATTVGERDAVEGERLPGPIHERLDGPRAAQDAPGHGREQLGLGRGARRRPRLPRRSIDDDAHEHGDHDVEEERRDVQRIVDRHGQQGSDEEVVEREPAHDRREHGRPQAAHERDDHDEQLERQHVRRDRLRAADGEERRGEHGSDAQRDGEAGEAPPRRERAAHPGQPHPQPAARRGVRHDVHVDRACLRDDGLSDARTGERRLQPAAARCADDELRRVHGSREADERGGDVVAHDLVVGAAELLDERPLPGEGLRVARAQPVLRRDVHREQVAAGRSCGDARTASQQRLALGAARERHDDALARLPGRLDALLGAIAAQRLVDLVGEPQQRELAQRREVAEPEVVRQRGVDALGRVHASAREPVAQRLRRQVDDLDRVGLAQHVVGDRLALRDARDALHDVVQRLDVLDVHGRHDVDAGREQLVHVLPALGVAPARRVRVRELVDERDARRAGQHGVEVHVVEPHAAVLAVASRHDLETLDHRGRRGAAVRLDEGDDDVGALGAQPPALLEHRVGLADAGSGAQQHPQPPPCHVSPPARCAPGRSLVRRGEPRRWRRPRASRAAPTVP